jgi:hypothetical protein
MQMNWISVSPKKWFLGIALCVSSTFASVDSTASLCSGAQACLGSAPAWCTEAQKKAHPDIKYDVGFCDEHRTLTGLGIRLEDPTLRKMWIQLGRPLRVEFSSGGLLPLKPAAIEFMLSHIPFATAMVNAYRGTNYAARYTSADSMTFQANKGTTLSGDFRFARLGTDGTTIVWGAGKAKVLTWALRGDALVFMNTKASGTGTLWQVRCVSFPEDNTVNSVMGSGIFKRKVQQYFQEIVGDISNAAQAYAKGNRGPVEASVELKAPEMQAQLKEFEAILNQGAAVVAP